VSRVLALIDGEHYPPVVRFALDALSEEHDVVGAVFIGGTEKVDAAASQEIYGVPVTRADSAEEALRIALLEYMPELVIDLSDEPVVSADGRFRIASIVLAAGVSYRGADFAFTPPRFLVAPTTPTMAIIGTGKRVGKTSISAYCARRLKSQGWDLVVLAMGRGGPSEPELIHGGEIELTTEDLLALAAQGKHASSDNYEGAVMSRVTTVGCRRCGGGLAGNTYFSNVPEGAMLADSLGKQLLVAEGSGAAIPPVRPDSVLLVVGAGQGEHYVRDYFGPYRLGLADAVIVAAAEEPNADAAQIQALVDAISELRPDVPVAVTTFRPKPIEDISGKKVFFATTAPAAVVHKLVEHLEVDHGCQVVAASPHLSDRTLLRDDLEAAQGSFDLVLTELKAAAIDVVASAAAEIGVHTVLCDNVPVLLDGDDLGQLVDDVAEKARDRANERD